MNGPLVSVILPVYNRARWVGRAIESVLAQTFQSFELLVIDDGSTDETLSVIESFSSRITILKQPHAGAEAARNLGLQRARGDFIAFMDSDDVWLPNRLRDQLPLLNRTEVGLVYGNADVVDYERGGRHRRKTFFDGVRPSRGRVLRQLARGCFIPFSSVLVRRKCFDEVGGFLHNCVAADYMKWVEISAHWEFDYLPEPVFEYAIHSGALSYNLATTLEDRLNSFRMMLTENRDPEIERVVRRIIFNTYLSLRITRMRSGIKVRGLTNPPCNYLQNISFREKLTWSLTFACNQVRTRAQWQLLKLTNAF